MLIAVGLFGEALALVLAGVRNQAAVLRNWEILLEPWGQDVYRELEDRVESETGMADYAYRRA